MESAVPIVDTILASINAVSTLGRENQRLQGKIEGNLGQLEIEVKMAEWDLAKYEGTDEKLTLQMQELLYDIHDFTSELSIPEKAAAFFHSLLAKDSRPHEIGLMESFLASIKSIGDRQKKISEQGNHANNPASAAGASTHPYAPEKDLDEGFPKTKSEFLELLSPAHGGKLRLISIVGCSGLGKTALARAVFEATHVPSFPPTTDTRVTEIPVSLPIAATKITPVTAVYEAAAVRQSPSTTREIHGATHAEPYPPTEQIQEPFPTNEAIRVQQSPASTEIHELGTANGATPVQSTPPIRAVYESNHVQIHGANKTTGVPPYTPVTEIHEVVAANEATAVQPYPPTAEIRETIAYDCKAWVEASTCKDVKDLLHKVLNTLGLKAAGTEAIRKFLLDKRYLIIIDDLRSCGVKWMDIEHAFPENCSDSRIIVTTSVHSIARDYSSARHYVYPLQCLNENNSQRLFRKQVFARCSRMEFSYPEKKLSENILAKCGGLPLALISAGNYLCWKEKNPHLSDDSYKEVCTELENIVTSDKPAFGAMKKMFAQCYTDLTDHDHKMCLLYLSIFPRGHQINSKSFVRRLKGEALVAGDVLKCLKELIDMSMVEPSLTYNDCNVAKTCQVQAMMLEFTIHKSVSRNMVTLVEHGICRTNKPDLRQKKVRRLTVQSSSSNKERSSSSSLWVQSGFSSPTLQSSSSRNDLIPDGIELSSVRSLMIFKTKLLPNSKPKFKSCKMMRVLDLEGCQGLNTVIDDICELVFLSYLSLRNTDLKELPMNVNNLKRLETLDVRQTRVEILLVEVMMLPALSHLFGEFELPLLDGKKRKALIKFLKEKSKLHTLAGIVVNKTESSKTVIEHARELKKVKIYEKKHSAPPPSPTPAPKMKSLIRAILPYLKDKQSSHQKVVADSRSVGVLVSSIQKRFLVLDSISIDSSAISKAFLASDHKAHSVISSIKLRGPLTSISGRTLKDLCNLKKLHLFSTGLSSQKLVDALQILNCLQYLKLVEEHHPGSWEGDFSVQKGGFPALRELSFEGAKKYPRLKITLGGMTLLTSLRLFCPHPTAVEVLENPEFPNPLRRVEGMEHLKHLDEVILHHTADVQTLKAWESAAREHTNMPCVKKQPKPSQPAFNNEI